MAQLREQTSLLPQAFESRAAREPRVDQLERSEHPRMKRIFSLPYRTLASLAQLGDEGVAINPAAGVEGHRLKDTATA